MGKLECKMNALLSRCCVAQSESSRAILTCREGKVGVGTMRGWRTAPAVEKSLSVSTQREASVVRCVPIFAPKDRGLEDDQCSTEGHTCHQHLAPVLLIISWILFYFYWRPKRTHKAKKSHEQHQRIFWTIRGGYRSLPSKTKVLRQISPESSPERSAKSLSHSFFVVPFLSPILGEELPVLAFTGAGPRRVGTSSGKKMSLPKKKPCKKQRNARDHVTAKCGPPPPTPKIS